ncbi:MAG: MotA/TolQ/ExbB proton channel family protein [Myxococcota bacterium]
MIDSFMSEFSVEHLLVLFMLACSLLLVAVALERALVLLRVQLSAWRAVKVVRTAQQDSVDEALLVCAQLKGPVAAILGAGLQRATGEVRGDPAMAMAREQKRLNGSMKARAWILGTAGALMPFVGLFGTVLGVMASFEAIGETGQGGFAIVSVGISQALIATAVGIAVALEGVVLFNVLQSITQKLSRDIALMADEILEMILVTQEERHAGRPRR